MSLHVIAPRLIAVAAAVASLAALPARADDRAAGSRDVADMSLEELLEVEVPTVTSASRHAERTLDAPASISVVTAEDIRRHGYRTLADVLGATTGFYATNDRNYEYAGTRGLLLGGDYNTRILVLIDGHRVNDALYGQAPLGTDGLVDLALVERIEIVRGPGSALYGSNALFATVNVVTRAAEGFGAAETTVAAGNFGLREVHGAFGRVLGPESDVVVAASTMHATGERLSLPAYDSPQHPGGHVDADHDANLRFFARARFRALTLEAGYSRRKKTVPTAPYGTDFGDARTRTIDQHGFVDAAWRAPLARGWALEAHATADSYRYRGVYAYDYPPKTLSDDVGIGESWGLESKATGGLPGRQTLTAGLEYRDNRRLDQHNWDRSPFVSYLDSHRRGHYFAGYLQDEAQLGAHVRLSLGLRYDDYDSFGGTASPRVALVVAPNPASAVKLIAGRAFRAPNGYELYYGTEAPVSGYRINPDLRPEALETIEAVYEHYFGTRGRVAAAAYHMSVSRMITLVYDPASATQMFRNAGRVHSSGVEFEGDLALPHGVGLRLGYAYANARDADSGAWLAGAPRHVVHARAVWATAAERFAVAGEFHYASPRRTNAGPRAGAFGVGNLVFSGRDVLPQVDVSLGVYNVLDRAYGEPGSDDLLDPVIPQPRRSVRLAVTIRGPRF